MSRPAPAKQNPMQLILTMLLVYMAVWMLFPKGNNSQGTTFQGKVLSTRLDYLNALKTCDQMGMEGTGQQLEATFNGLIDDDVKRKVLTQDQGDAEKIEGAVYVANAFYKGGLRRDDTGKIRMGYQVLQGYQRRMSTGPGWTQPVTVTDVDGKSHDQVSGQAMFDKIVESLKQRNRTDLVYGFLPGWQLIDFLVHLTGAVSSFSYAFAAFLLALLVRAIVFPLAQKQLMFSRQMGQLTPRVKEIKERYEGDPTMQNTKTMELYREYGINPFSGCLPAFIQMPLFISVYQFMLRYQFQFQNGTFLWINPVTSKATHGIVAPNLGQQDYILIVIYGITMLCSTLLTPVTDPTQKTTQRMMGVVMSIGFTVFMFLGFFPVVSGFVLYWTFTNLLATAQSLRAYRLPMPPLVKVNTPTGGVYPSGAPKGKWAQIIDEMQARVHEEQRKQIEARPDEPDSPGSNGAKDSKSGPTNGKPKGTASTNGKAKSGKGSDEGEKSPKYKPKKRS